MEDRKIDKTKERIIVLFLLILCLGYLTVKATQAAYESIISGSTNQKVAKWNIKVNGVRIDEVEESLEINYSSATSANGREGKIGPGSALVYPIVVDPNGTEVAIRFDVKVVDNGVDDTKYFTLNSITADNSLTLTKTAADTYTCIIPKTLLDTTTTITLNLKWEDDGTLVEYDPNSTDDSFIELSVYAEQYKGETITEYHPSEENQEEGD